MARHPGQELPVLTAFGLFSTQPRLQYPQLLVGSCAQIIALVPMALASPFLQVQYPQYARVHLYNMPMYLFFQDSQLFPF